MPVTPSEARALALALPDATEAPHMHRIAFRTPRKIFATLDPVAGDMNLMFDPDLRDFFCAQEPAMFAPVPRGWGRRGATCCTLRAADRATLESALLAAHRLATPAARRPRR